MKQIVTAAIVVFTVISAGRANAEDRANSLRDGVSAFQVMFEGGLNSGALLFKHHFNARNALRLGFFGQVSVRDEELDVPDIGTGEYENDYSSFSVDLTYLRYVGAMKSASFYFGAGPFLEFAEQTRVRVEDEFGVGIRYDSSDEQAMALGALVSLGTEWFITESLSLAFEYAMSASYRWYERDEVFERPDFPRQTQNWEGHSWEANASRYARIGFGIYL